MWAQRPRQLETLLLLDDCARKATSKLVAIVRTRFCRCEAKDNSDDESRADDSGHRCSAVAFVAEATVHAASDVQNLRRASGDGAYLNLAAAAAAATCDANAQSFSRAVCSCAHKALAPSSCVCAQQEASAVCRVRADRLCWLRCCLKFHDANDDDGGGRGHRFLAYFAFVSRQKKIELRNSFFADKIWCQKC